MRAPALLLALPLIAQSAQAPRPATPGSGRPAQGRPQGPGMPGRGGAPFRPFLDLGTSIHRLWTRNLDLAPGWSRTDPELRLLWNEELRVETPSEAQVQALWGKEGWNLDEPRVVLLGAEDRVIANWGGEPRPEEVLSALKSSGWQSRLTRLEAFLREHPDQGQARLDQIQILATRLLRLDPTQDPGLTSEVIQSLATSFEHLRELPRWPREAPSTLWSFLLAGSLDRDPPALGADLRRRLREDVEEELLRTPQAAPLWALWARLATEPEQAGSLVARLPRLPGEAILPPGAGQPLVAFHLRCGGFTHLETLATQVIPGTTTWSADAAWRSARVAALFGQGRKDEAFRTLQADLEALPDVGFMAQVSGLVPLFQPRADGTPVLDADDRSRLERMILEGGRQARARTLAKAKARGEESQEEIPLLRLDWLGGEGDPAAWLRLARNPAFDDWGPGELAFGTLTGKAADQVLERQGWAPGPRWILRNGEDLVDSGEGLPTPAQLSETLARHHQPLLSRLRTLLKAHPDLTAARLQRLQIVRQRLPHPRLEALLLEDAQRLDEPFLREGLVLQPELWRAPARRKVAELEGFLTAWPHSERGWRAWLDWTSILEGAEAGDLISHLPQPPRLAGEPGPLPIALGIRIAEGLLAQGRTSELAKVGRAFWEELRPVLATATQVGSRAEGGEGRPRDIDMARWAQSGMALTQVRNATEFLRSWVTALRATRQGPEADAVVAALEAIQPGLGRRLTEGGRRSAVPTTPSRPAPPAGGTPPR